MGVKGGSEGEREGGKRVRAGSEEGSVYLY